MKLISIIGKSALAGIGRIKRAWYWLGLRVVLLVAAMECHADGASQGLAGMKSNVSSQAVAGSTIIQTLIALGGVATAAVGIYKLYQAGKSDQSREESTTGWRLLGIATICLSVWSLIYFLGGTIWGDGQASTQQQRTLIQQQ